MAGFFDLSDHDLQKILIAEGRRKRDLEEGKLTIKTGSGTKPESLKLYNKYKNGEPIKARKYYSDDYLREEVEYTVSDIQNTKKVIDNIFGIDAYIDDVAKIASSLFYDPSNEEILNIKVIKYYRVLDIIKTAHIPSDAKIRATIETLDSLGIEQPSELKTAVYVRDNYAKNQLRKAVSDAVKIIFPQITDKNILDQIAAKALA